MATQALKRERERMYSGRERDLLSNVSSLHGAVAHEEANPFSMPSAPEQSLDSDSVVSEAVVRLPKEPGLKGESPSWPINRYSIGRSIE